MNYVIFLDERLLIYFMKIVFWGREEGVDVVCVYNFLVVWFSLG